MLRALWQRLRVGYAASLTVPTARCGSTAHGSSARDSRRCVSAGDRTAVRGLATRAIPVAESDVTSVIQQELKIAERERRICIFYAVEAGPSPPPITIAVCASRLMRYWRSCCVRNCSLWGGRECTGSITYGLQSRNSPRHIRFLYTHAPQWYPTDKSVVEGLVSRILVSGCFVAERRYYGIAKQPETVEVPHIRVRTARRCASIHPVS